MKKIFFIYFLLVLPTFVCAWDFTYKLNAYQYRTSNVNLDDTNTSDSATNYNLSLQAKEDDWKIKFKGQRESYQKETQNDFYTTDIGVTYNRTLDNDFSLSYFTQIYNNTPAINADYAADNSGIRVNSNLYNDLGEDLTSYVSLGLTTKNYKKLNSRQDRSLFASVGLESYLSSILTLSPDLSVSYTSSNNSDYNTINYGPGLFINVTPLEALELFSSISYNRTVYRDRLIQTTDSRGRARNEQMYQELFSSEVGVSYYVTKNIPLTLKYNSNKNQSNDSTYNYKATLTSFGLGFKF